MGDKFQWWVGLFTVLGLAAILVLALRVSNLQIGGSDDSYRLYAYFDEIGGLKPKAPITLSGVVIGRIGNITLDLEHFQAKVELLINKDYDQLPEDTSASILTSGILGEKYIGLTLGGAMDMLLPESIISETQSAVVLENLISKFFLDSQESN